MCAAGLGPGQYRVSMPPRKKDQEFVLRIDSSSAFGQPEPHLTTLPNPALHVPCAAIASCWAFNDVSCVCPGVSCVCWPNAKHGSWQSSAKHDFVLLEPVSVCVPMDILTCTELTLNCGDE